MFSIPEDKKLSIKYPVIFTTAIVISVSVWAIFFRHSSIDEQQTHQVFKGDLVEEIRAHGKLKANTRNSLIALSSGMIEEITLKPGANVVKGQPIIKLFNPKLNRQVEEAKLQLLEEQSNIDALKTELNQAYWQQESSIDIAQSDLSILKADLDAKTQLHEKNIISKLDLHKAKMAYENQKLKIQVAKNKLISMEKINKANLTSHQYKLQRVTSQLEMLKKDLANLVITAPIDGIVLQLNDNLEIGQQIAEGVLLGMIVDNSDLYGEMTISASQADKLQIEQSIAINIRGDHYPASISRISPNVNNGELEFDVVFERPLPQHILPNTDVSGSLQVTLANSTLLANRMPVVNRPYSYYDLWVMNNGEDTMTKTQIQIGAITTNHMEILTGAKESQLLMIPANN